MIRRNQSCARPWLAFVLTLPLHAGFCSADETSTVPAKATTEPVNMLVLRDGGVLTGNVSRVDDHYLIHRGGTEIQVPATNVLVACRSIIEGYEARRASAAQPSVEFHLSLATWCLQHGLNTQAARELVDARRKEPNHPRISLLERRLAAANSNSSPKSTSSDGSPRLTETKTITTMKESQLALPSAEIETLSSTAVERFTRKVQPILVNNCTTSGCHHRGGAQQFQLDRALLHGLANRRSTSHNLAATLALVDREQPQLSPLLIVPRQTHGGMHAPIFGPRQAALFNHLVDWVGLVTRRGSSEPAPFPTDRPNDAITLANNAGLSVASQNGAMQESASSVFQADQEQVPRPAKPPIRYGVNLEPWQPKDEFDPEIFNRQQRARPPVVDEDIANEPSVPNAQR